MKAISPHSKFYSQVLLQINENQSIIKLVAHIPLLLVFPDLLQFYRQDSKTHLSASLIWELLLSKDTQVPHS